MFDYSQKIVLITGAGGALGSTVSRQFHDAGANVVLFDLYEEPLQRVKESLGDQRVSTFALDLTNEKRVSAAIEDIVERFGHIDVLANIAGGFQMSKKTHELDLSYLDKMIDMNVRTMLTISKHVLKNMTHNGYGRIINVGARAGKEGKANMGAYCGAKSMVMRLTESMAKEYQDTNISINAILPGTIDTPRNRDDMPGADFSIWVKPAQIGDLILYLGSDMAEAMKGSLVPVYGQTL